MSSTFQFLKWCKILFYWIVNFQIWFWCHLIIYQKSIWVGHLRLWLFPWTYPIALKHVINFLFTTFKIVPTLFRIAPRWRLPRILHIHFWGRLWIRLWLFSLLCLRLLIFNACGAQLELHLLFLLDDLSSYLRFFLFGLFYLRGFVWWFHFILWFSFNKILQKLKAVWTDLTIRFFSVNSRFIFLIFLSWWTVIIKNVLIHFVAVLNLYDELGILYVYCLLSMVSFPPFMLFIFLLIMKLTFWRKTLSLRGGSVCLFLHWFNSRGPQLYVLILVIYMV